MSSVILKISPQFLISSYFFSKNFLVQLHRQLKQTHNLCNVSTLNWVDSTKTVVHNKRDEKNEKKSKLQMQGQANTVGDQWLNSYSGAILILN